MYRRTTFLFQVLVVIAAQSLGGASPVSTALSIPASAAEELKLTDGQRELGYVVCQGNPTMPAYRERIPRCEDIARKFTCSLAQDEYEAVEIPVYVPKNASPLAEVTLDVDSDISHEVRAVHYQTLRVPRPSRMDQEWEDVNAARKAFQGTPETISLPYALLPGSAIKDVQPGTNAAFWVTFHTTRSTAPGMHKGRLSITANGKRTSLPLEINVRPFVLPPADITFGTYGHLAFIPDPYRSMETLRMGYRDRAKHGENTVVFDETETPEGTAYWKAIMDNRGQVDFKAWPGNVFAEAALDTGLLKPDSEYYSFCRVMFDSADIAKAVTNYLEFCREKSWSAGAVACVDEPGYHRMESRIPVLATLREIPGVKAATSTDSLGIMSHGHVHDIWIVMADCTTPALMHEAELQGAEVWEYHVNAHGTNPLMNRYFTGLHTWALGLRGNVTWAYNETVGSSVVTDDGNVGYTERGYVLYGRDGIVPTVGWEARREGIDDYRYIRLLEAAVSRAPANDRTASEAKAWLARLRKRVPRTGLSGGFGSLEQGTMNFVNPARGIAPQEYDSVREQVTKYLAKIRALDIETMPHVRQTKRLAEWLPLKGKSLEECRQWLENKDVYKRRAAMAAIAMMDDGTESALPDMIKALDDPDVRIWAMRALIKLGPKALPAAPRLGEILRSKDKFIRAAAVTTLMHIGPETVNQAREVLGDSSSRVRFVPAAEIVGNPGPQWKPWVPYLIRSLNEDPINLHMTMLALENIGEPASPAIPALKQFVHDARFGKIAESTIKKITGAR